MNNLRVEKSSTQVLDKLGILCSFGCIVHCLIFPVVTYFAPVISSYAENEYIHFALLAAIAPILLITFIQQYKNHKKSLPGVYAILGFVSLILALLFEAHHADSYFTVDKILTFVGSLLLIIGHVYNILLERRKSNVD